ncbi:hypothetical protein FRX31_022652 [Thalictrum thalictroides]|uniref:Uncharacterized protein n=1 Tax=Thalictrum thalictroides TaxID=46969 RepID=A0A7J6VTP0_THATH|nr:hypothetical protein FRX31_022652 [Thalictrum thalictroides]
MSIDHNDENIPPGSFNGVNDSSGEEISQDHVSQSLDTNEEISDSDPIMPTSKPTTEKPRKHGKRYKAQPFRSPFLIANTRLWQSGMFPFYKDKLDPNQDLRPEYQQERKLQQVFLLVRLKKTTGDGFDGWLLRLQGRWV